MLKTSTALAAGVLFAEPVRAAASPPSSVTPELLEAARKEGKLSFYSALELSVGGRVGKAFKYPRIAVRVERSGAERIFQRIAQEQANGIDAVDVANSTDPADYLDWKSKDRRRCQVFPGGSGRSGRRCWRRARKSRRATPKYSRCDRFRRRRITFGMS